MPILAAEPDLYPLDLWDGAIRRADEEETSSRWWCLHTKPRQEKATARYLRAKAIPFYLPLSAQLTSTPSGRKFRASIPIFPGYVFMRSDERGRDDALRGHTLVQILDVPDQDELEHDLRQIYQLSRSGQHLRPEPSYAVGSPVRIVNGPLQGLVGLVIRRKGAERFVAVVRFLRQGARIELRDAQVEPVSNPAALSGLEGPDVGE